MNYFKIINNFNRSGQGITTFLILIIIWFFLDCQKNVITIQEIKGTGWEQYIGESITVEGIFIKDTIPMLVTDLKMVTLNLPIPYNQYLLLYGKEVEIIDPNKFGGARMYISGKVREVNKGQVKYRSDKLVLEVFKIEILDIPKVPYAPKLHNMEQDSLIH